MLLDFFKKLFRKKPSGSGLLFVPFGKEELVDIRNEVSNRINIVNRLFIQNSTINADSLAMYQIIAHDLELTLKSIVMLSTKRFYLYNDKVLTDASIDVIELNTEMRALVASSLAAVDPDAPVRSVLDMIKSTISLSADQIVDQYGVNMIYRIGKFKVVELP